MTGASDRDPGLQPERTRLAWRRTTLSCTVAAVLAAKQALHGGTTPVGLVAVALSGLVWLGFLAVAHRRIQSLTRSARPGVLRAREAVATLACVAALALFAVAMLL
ncbi:DUF202 domain-containing protein [Streptomyces melanogenes]|uniref:DUF202 domain-containing protein n=1 Tax=Streptomyces melanogenes TaxID=67326 RepID=A0ABZ1XG04_9ACTN|nr:DUF202 domain-containing protein [Streptomyces melanogenes]